MAQPTPTAQDFCDRALFRAVNHNTVQAQLDDQVYAVTECGRDAIRITGHGVNVTLGSRGGKFVPEEEAM